MSKQAELLLSTLTITTPEQIIAALQTSSVDISKPLTIKNLLEICDYLSIIRVTLYQEQLGHPSMGGD